MRYFTLGLSILVIIQFADTIAPTAFLDNLKTLVTGLTLLFALPFGSKPSRLLALFMIVTGSFLFTGYGAGPEVFSAGLTRMSKIIVLLAVAPVIGRFFLERGYIGAVTDSATRLFKRPFGLYSSTTLLTYVIGSVVSAGCVVILWDLLRGVFQRREDMDEKAFPTSILRGFMAVTIWSPSIGAVAIALTFTGVDWTSFLPWGFGMAGIGLTINLLLAFRDLRGREGRISADKSLMDPAASSRLSLELIAVVILFITTVAFLDATTKLTILELVPLVTVAFTLLGFTATGKVALIVPNLKAFIQGTFPNRTNEFILLTSAGFFSEAVRLTGLGAAAFGALQNLLGNSLSVLTAVIPLLVIFLGFTGFPPSVSTAVLAGAIDPALRDQAPLLITLSLLLGSSISNNVCPFAPTVLLEAGLAKRSPFMVGTAWNWAYALIFYLVVVIGFFRLVPTG